MSSVLLAHYMCAPCDVEGRDIDPEPICWNCGGEVTITARPTVTVRSGADAE